MSKIPKMYGVIKSQRNISFVLDGFQCTFFNSIIDSRDGAVKGELIKQNDGYIIGETVNGNYIHIYTGQDIEIDNQLTLNTWLYLVSPIPENISYMAISFEGGILRKLFYRSALKLDHTETDSYKPQVHFQNDCLTFELTNEKIKGKMSIKSIINEERSLEAGASISLSGPMLEICFDEEKTIISFPDILGYILNLCQFMAFRRNIMFEKIALKIRYSDNSGSYEEIAQCYIKFEGHASIIEKSIYNCITFNQLGKSTEKLLDSIVDNKPQKPQFNIGFLPESDKDAYKINSIKIREVCSALESELELMSIEVQHEAEFDCLINELKSLVKKHRKGENPLKNSKAYDYIFGNLRHLSGALSDRIERCSKEYQLLIDEISREEIDRIVDYRNNITHGNYMILNNDLADTAFKFFKLVYCCILKRIGLEDDMIIELFKRNIIS